ncbi:MAG: DUF1385 domain-containing protein [Patulibacter minatonensis]
MPSPTNATTAATPSRDLPVGGQAVLEGVMMRGTGTWSVAVRLAPDHPTDPGGIDVTTEPFQTVLARHRWLRLPILRGAVGLVESMGVGVRALGISANASSAAAGDDAPQLKGVSWALTVAAGLGLAVALFFLLPATLTKLTVGSEIENGLLFVAVEKAVRLTIFFTYLVLVSRLPHLQRVFRYHSAEHQSIACLEAGLPLTPENAARFPRLHPRCGTSFMFLVMLVSFVVFAPLGNLPLGWLLLSRIVGIPLVAGLAFEAIKWMGRRRDLRLARALTWPGMQLQRLTTRPCEGRAPRGRDRRAHRRHRPRRAEARPPRRWRRARARDRCLGERAGGGTCPPAVHRRCAFPHARRHAPAGTQHAGPRDRASAAAQCRAPGRLRHGQRHREDEHAAEDVGDDVRLAPPRHVDRVRHGIVQDADQAGTRVGREQEGCARRGTATRELADACDPERRECEPRRADHERTRIRGACRSADTRHGRRRCRRSAPPTPAPRHRTR